MVTPNLIRGYVDIAEKGRVVRLGTPGWATGGPLAGARSVWPETCWFFSKGSIWPSNPPAAGFFAQPVALSCSIPPPPSARRPIPPSKSASSAAAGAATGSAPSFPSSPARAWSRWPTSCEHLDSTGAQASRWAASRAYYGPDAYRELAQLPARCRRDRDAALLPPGAGAGGGRSRQARLPGQARRGGRPRLQAAFWPAGRRRRRRSSLPGWTSRRARSPSTRKLAARVHRGDIGKPVLAQVFYYAGRPSKDKGPARHGSRAAAHVSTSTWTRCSAATSSSSRISTSSTSPTGCFGGHPLEGLRQRAGAPTGPAPPYDAGDA